MLTNSRNLRWFIQLRQLAVMIDAGLPYDSALKSLSEHSDSGSNKHRIKLLQARKCIKSGLSLPDAFRRTALVTEFDHALLTSADGAGKLANGLDFISRRRIDHLQGVESLKASLVFPKALVILGAIAGVLIRNASGGQSLLEATISVGLIISLFYAVIFSFILIVRADTRMWMSWFWPYRWIHKFMHWYRLSLENLFYSSLTWQVSAGVPASKATLACGALLSSTAFQNSVMSASKSMSRGVSITKALSDEGLVLTDRLRQVLLIADGTGTHEAAIKQELRLQAIHLKQKADDFFKWAPRVAYVVALIFISKLIGT